MKRKALIIWGAVVTGFLGANILYTWVIWESGKVMLFQYGLGQNAIRDELNKIKQEMRILKSRVEYSDSVIKENEEATKTNQTEENRNKIDLNYKMYPNTQRKGEYEFFVTNNQVVIVKFHGLGIENHVIIPEKIQEMPVVKLGNMSFSRIIQRKGVKSLDNLKKVNLPETLEKIESGAFQMNYNLSEINFPPKVSIIEDHTFAFCGFTNLNLPTNIQKIGKAAFMANWNLTNVIIPSNVKFIGEKSFAGCTNLANIQISAKNTIIESDAFEFCPTQPFESQSSTNPQ